MKRIRVVNTDLFILVDDEDYELVNSHKWFSCRAHAKNGDNRITGIHTSVKGEKRQKTVYVHRMIMNPPKGMVVDHINRNVLDNRKENLRVCTNQQNSFNARARVNKPYKGVTSTGVSFRSRITKDYVTYNLGFYATAEEAAEAYNKKAIELFGEFASINVL